MYPLLCNEETGLQPAFLKCQEVSQGYRGEGAKHVGYFLGFSPLSARTAPVQRSGLCVRLCQKQYFTALKSLEKQSGDTIATACFSFLSADRHCTIQWPTLTCCHDVQMEGWEIEMHSRQAIEMKEEGLMAAQQGTIESMVSWKVHALSK